MKKIILTLTIFQILFSCKKSNSYKPFVIPCSLTTDSSLAKTYIKGTWEWVEEKRLVLGQNDFSYLTPKTEGYSLKMIIGDSTLKFYKNNQLTDYKYKIQLLGEISGTNFPEDSLPVLVFYSFINGSRDSHVPIKICQTHFLVQYQFVTSQGGERIWKKK